MKKIEVLYCPDRVLNYAAISYNASYMAARKQTGNFHSPDWFQKKKKKSHNVNWLLI